MSKYLLLKSDGQRDDPQLGLTSDSRASGGVVGADTYNAADRSLTDYLELDAAGSEYVALDSYLTTSTAGLSVTAWVRTTQTSGEGIIASHDRSEWYRLNVNNGNLDCSFNTDSGTFDIDSGAFIADGRWHHVAIVYDAGEIRQYVDGRLVDSNTGNGSSVQGIDRYGFIGTGSEAGSFDGGLGPNNWFDGDVAHYRLYTDALTDAEVIDTWSGNAPTDSLFQYLPLNGTVGDRFDDRSGNNNDGFLRNGAALVGSDIVFEDAEDNDVSDWTVNEGSVFTESNPSIESLSLRHQGMDGTVDPRKAVKSVDSVSNPDSATFSWYETSSNTSATLTFYNSNGNKEISVGTDNPRQYVQDGDGEYALGDGTEGYQNWYKFTIQFNWQDGTYRIVVTDRASSYSQKAFGPLMNGVDIAEVASGQIGVGGYTGTGQWNLDQIRFNSDNDLDTTSSTFDTTNSTSTTPVGQTTSGTFTRRNGSLTTSTSVPAQVSASSFFEQTGSFTTSVTPNAVRSSTGAGTVVTEVFPNRNREDFRGEWGGEIEYYEWDGVRGLENTYENYSQRVRGWLIPPETGTYYFWISADNTGDLWLDDTQILDLNDWTAFKDWTKYPDQQKSNAIELTAGVPVKFEAYMYEQGGGDNLGVGWRKPSDGDGSTPVGLVPAEHFQSAVGARSTSVTGNTSSTTFANRAFGTFTNQPVSVAASSVSNVTRTLGTFTTQQSSPFISSVANVSRADAFTATFTGSGTTSSTTFADTTTSTATDQRGSVSTSTVANALRDSFDAIDLTGRPSTSTFATGVRETAVSTSLLADAPTIANVAGIVQNVAASPQIDDSTFASRLAEALPQNATTDPLIATPSNIVIPVASKTTMTGIGQTGGLTADAFVVASPTESSAAADVASVLSETIGSADTTNTLTTQLTPTTSLVVNVQKGGVGIEGTFADSLAASVGASTFIKVAKTNSTGAPTVGAGTTSVSIGSDRGLATATPTPGVPNTATTAVGLITFALFDSLTDDGSTAADVVGAIETFEAIDQPADVASLADANVAVTESLVDTFQASVQSNSLVEAVVETAEATEQAGVATTSVEAVAIAVAIATSEQVGRPETATDAGALATLLESTDRTAIGDSSVTGDAFAQDALFDAEQTTGIAASTTDGETVSMLTDVFESTVESASTSEALVATAETATEQSTVDTFADVVAVVAAASGEELDTVVETLTNAEALTTVGGGEGLTGDLTTAVTASALAEHVSMDGVESGVETVANVVALRTLVSSISRSGKPETEAFVEALKAAGTVTPLEAFRILLRPSRTGLNETILLTRRNYADPQDRQNYVTIP